MTKNYKPFVPVVILFLLLTVLFIAGRSRLEDWGADQAVLIWGNLFLFGITFLSYLVAIKGLGNPNPHAFVRSVYSSIMLKLFLSMIAAFIYIASYRKELNKPALFTLMGLYLVYTFIEVSALLKMLRHKNP